MLAAGCGQSAEMKQMGFQGPAPVVPKSDAINRFMGPEGLTALYKNFDDLASSTAGLREEVKQPKFAESYEAFRKDPIPDGFKSEQREQDKAKLVEAVDALMGAVKKNASDQEIRTLAQPIRPAAEAFMRATNY